MRPSAYALFLLAFLAGCGDASDEPDGAPPRAEIIPVNAGEMREAISDVDADLVVLNVWATWCGPCRAEFPEFVRYGRERAGEGIAVRFLSVDDPAMEPQVQQFLDLHGVTGPSYLSSEGAEIAGRLAAPNPWEYGIPVTFLFDGDGTLRAYWEGAATYDFLDARVRQVLAPASTPPVTAG